MCQTTWLFLSCTTVHYLLWLAWHVPPCTLSHDQIVRLPTIRVSQNIDCQFFRHHQNNHLHCLPLISFSSKFKEPNGSMQILRTIKLTDWSPNTRFLVPRLRSIWKWVSKTQCFYACCELSYAPSCSVLWEVKVVMQLAGIFVMLGNAEFNNLQAATFMKEKKWYLLTCVHREIFWKP